VCFVGPKGELPAGDGTYGTSVPWGKAMDPANDILIAYKHVSARVWLCVFVPVLCTLRLTPSTVI
jgi:hypothetical protein